MVDHINVLPPPRDALHLKGHTDSVYKFAILSGGDRIVTASRDNTARVFSLVSGKCIQLLQGHQDFVRGIDTIDAHTIVSAGRDKTVRIWRIPDGKLLCTKDICQRASTCASLGAGRLLITGEAGALYEMEWNGSQLMSRRTISKAHDDWVRRISVHDGRFATVSDDHTAKVWDATTLKCIRMLTGHTNWVQCVAMNAYYIVTGSADSTIRVYDSSSLQFLRCIHAHHNWINELVFVHDGQAVLSGSRDQTVALHILRTGACRWRVRIGILIFALAALPDGRVAAAGWEPFDVRIFSTPWDKLQADACAAVRAQPELTIKQSGELVTAFACALIDPSVLDESFLLKYIKADNVQAAPDLVAGHNLILLSIRLGVITSYNVHTFGGSSWHLKDNLYLPATKIGTDDPQLIHFIFHHAESLGIISGGYQLKVAQQIRADVRTETEAVFEAIGALSERITALESRASTLEGSVEQLHAALSNMHLNQQTLREGIESLSRNLTNLQAAIRIQNKHMTYVGIARCLLSFIPLVGNAVGHAAYTSAELFMNLTAEHLVPAGVDVVKAVVTGLAHVDLSNFQVAQHVFSNNTLAQLETPAKDAIIQAVSGSSFRSLQELQSSLHEHIVSTGSTAPAAALLDMGLSSWLSKRDDSAETSSSTREHPQDAGARKYFQFLAHAIGGQAITLFKATCELNDLLKKSDGLSEVSSEHLQQLFFELADEDDEDVKEDVFVDIFRAIREEQNAMKRKRELLEECSARFQKHAYADGSMPLLLAARVLRNLHREMERRGFVETGSALEISAAVEELQKLSANGERSKAIEEGEFISAVKSLMQ